MNDTIKLLKTMLRDSNLAAHAEIFTKNNSAFGRVTHPTTGVVASFAIRNSRSREAHSLANQAARMRRFYRIGHDLATGQPYCANA
jgi:hypothetical protein